MLLNLSVLFVFLSISSCDCANILYMALIASPSHHIWNSVIVDALAQRGHNVTVISPYINRNAPPRVHYIPFENDFQSILGGFAKRFMNHLNESTNQLLEQFSIVNLISEVCSESLNTTGTRTLLNYPSDFKFDLVINDFTLGSCLLPFVHKFNYPPLIAISACGHPPYLNDLVGDHHYYAYVPQNVSPFHDEMSFFQRYFNFLIYFEEMILMRYYLNPRLDEMSEEYFGSNKPTIRELEQKTVLAFISTSPVMDYLAPLPESVIPVAGAHIKDPKPFPADLESFLNLSKKGAVILSLGTNFLSEYVPIEKRNTILSVFRELSDYNFLWKFESKLPTNEIPSNVQIRTWLPITDLLVHKKIKAIFFHGGLLTTQEALWRGIPMIIMPFAIDQRQNLIKMKKLGVGEGVDYSTLNAPELKSVLLKVLENKSYAQNAKKWSAKFRDQKEKPLDRAIWWIEWVLRNPNCDHLKSPVHGLGYIVGNAYDIIACVILISTLLTVLIAKFFGYCVRKMFVKKEGMSHIKED